MAMKQDFEKYQKHEPRPPEEVPEGVVISEDTRRGNRMPPGQSRTKKWPVLHASYVPTIDLEKWRLRIFGLVENELSFTWEEFKALPRVKVYADFHCVTRWSRLDNVWEGVSVKDIIARAGVKPETKFVIAHGFDGGWTTNMPFHEFASDDCLLADLHDGEPLTPDHGGPLRLIVPKLYAWKSAKWLKALEFSATDKPGYWEENGYHNYGDPWREERFNEDAFYR
jgi:DMSO/TMAO reductase YedYZ molybdopterin-dependent catalytic subunit